MFSCRRLPAHAIEQGGHGVIEVGSMAAIDHPFERVRYRRRIGRRRPAAQRVVEIFGERRNFRRHHRRAARKRFEYDEAKTFTQRDHCEDIGATEQSGHIGVVDFYIARKWPAPGMRWHSGFTRMVWPAWFGCDNVFLSPDHLPWLQSHFQTVRLEERRGRVSWTRTCS